MEKASDYFNKVALPLINAHLPDLVEHMSVTIRGSHGLGQEDSYSDLDIIVYLEDSIWRERGKLLQLLMQHPPRKYKLDHSFYCEAEMECLYGWHVWGHSEVNVHPLSWVLAGYGEDFLKNEGEEHWDKVTIENLFEIEHQIVLSDPANLFSRLREKTLESNAPEWFWKKHLILTFCGLKGVPHAFEVAVKRKRMLEANLTLHPVLKGLLQIGFLIEKRYYPWWENHQEWSFRKLSLSDELLPHFQMMISHPDWSARVSAMHTVIRKYTDLALERGMINREDIEHLFAAKKHQAWKNPDWMEAWREHSRKAQEAGHLPEDGWIWELWGDE